MIPLFKVAMAPEALRLVNDTLYSGYIGEGPRVAELEQALADVLGAPVLCTNSCTSALDMAYHLIGLGEGDEVISTPMTCLATNMPLALRRCKIVWADVDPRTGNIAPESVASLVTPHTKAIVCADWAGRQCDYEALRIAGKGIPIVEDAAHAFGAMYENIYHKSLPVAVFSGTYICWSFQAIKHLTTGDGGALKVPDRQRGRARLLRWYGLDRNDSTAMRCLQQASEPGFKYQMNDIAATIGLANLSLALEHVEQQRANARYYNEHLPEGLTAPYDPGAAYWLYTILVDDPADFERKMAEQGVQTSQVHTRNDRQNCLPTSDRPLPGLDEFSSHMISIPVGWWLSKQDLGDIVYAVSKTLRSKSRAAV